MRRPLNTKRLPLRTPEKPERNLLDSVHEVLRTIATISFGLHPGLASVEGLALHERQSLEATLSYRTNLCR